MSAANDPGAGLRAALHRGDLIAGAAAPEFALRGAPAAWVAAPADGDELQRCVRAAAASAAVLLPCGLGARLAIGFPPERVDVALSTRRMNRIVAHEAADMTLVVEAGTTLAAVDAALAPHGQRLPVDPPHPGRTTVGGLIAADPFGPLRAAQGRVRDLLIGVKAVLADGTAVKGGGRVVKNVAGYDLMKLLCGSFGTLAIISEAAFKLRPRPQHRRFGRVPYGDLGAALAGATRLRALPFVPACARVLDAAAAGDGPTLVVGLEGSAIEIEAMVSRVRGVLDAEPRWEDDDAATCLHAHTRDSQLTAAGEALAMRIGTRPGDLAEVIGRIVRDASADGVALAVVADVASGTGYVRIGAEAAAAVRMALAIRRAVRVRGGFAVVADVGAAFSAELDPWGEDGDTELMRGIKSALDPERRLSPGRFVGGI